MRTNMEKSTEMRPNQHKIRILEYNLSIESIFIQFVFMITIILHKIQKSKKIP